MNAPPPLPRWFLVLPLLAAAPWWPWSPYWKSDDYLMLQHASDLRAVLADFVGPQYGATDLWFFHRPLMTASFWLELQVFGVSPLASHATNALVHGGSALLVGLLWRRWLGDRRGFAAGLLWALMPSHQGAITWAVGRSDGHGTFWSLLALLLFLRHRERIDAHRPSRPWACQLATAAALLTKEIAFVVAPIATLLAFVRGSGPVGARAGHALRAAGPLWLVFGLLFALRCAALGRVGGYAEMQYTALPMLRGFGHVLADLLVPLRWIGGADVADACGLSPAAVGWLAALPLLAIAAWHLTTRRGVTRLGTAAALFAVACVPMAPFLLAADNPHNLRYYCLPTVALAGVLVGPRLPLAATVLVAWAWPLVAARTAVHAADQFCRTRHEALLRAAAAGAAEPLFVAGLPTVDPTVTAILFLHGADRLLGPPFTTARHRLLPVRPVVAVPPPFRFDDDAAGPERLPGGSTWWFHGDALVAAHRTGTLPNLPIAGDRDGVVDLSSASLAAMERQRQGTRLELGTARAQAYRVTIFTALGYFGCLCPEHAKDGAPRGALDLLQFFAGDVATGTPRDASRIPPAQFAPGPAGYVMRGLEVPTTHDLDTEFPVLIEAGTLQGDRFVPTHRARRLLTFRFDRGYPAWVRAALGL